jgi:hypothetical protein
MSTEYNIDYVHVFFLEFCETSNFEISKVHK